MSRAYAQGCPVAHALDLIGERWSLLVVRELRLGPRRYADLQRALPDIGPSMLSQRLRDLQAAGVVVHRPTGYALTEYGYDLDPVFTALARWGLAAPVRTMSGDTSNDAVMLGVRTFLGEPRSPQWTATYSVRLVGDTYRIGVVDGAIDSMERGEAAGPVDVTIETDRTTVAEILSARTSYTAARRAGRITVHGDKGAAGRLFAR